MTSGAIGTEHLWAGGSAAENMARRHDAAHHPAADRHDHARAHGERAARTEAVRRKSGIPIPERLWDELRALAEANGVELPQTLSALAK